MYGIRWLILLFTTSLCAQTPYFINYTDKDGLPTNELYSVIQTKKGAIWIGSDAGLIHYDGLNFKLYHNSIAKNKSVTNLFEDEDGDIWCTNFSNQLLLLKEDSLHIIESWDSIRKEGNVLYEIDFSDIPGVLIIQTARKTFKIDKANNYKISVEYPAQRIHYTAKGDIYSYSSSQGLVLTKNKEDFPIPIPELIFRIQSNRLSNSILYPAGHIEHIGTSIYLWLSEQFITQENFLTQNLWGQTLDQIDKVPYLFSVNKNRTTAIYFPPELSQYKNNLQIAHLIATSDSLFYISTNIGLFRWNRFSDEVNTYFPGQFISQSTIDREGNIWATSLDKGLYFIPPHIATIHPIQSKASRLTKLDISPAGILVVGVSNGNIEGFDLQKDQSIFQKKLANKEIEAIKYKPSDNIFLISSRQSFGISPKGKIVAKNIPILSSKELLLDQNGNIIIVTGRGVEIKNQDFKKPPKGLPNQWFQEYALDFDSKTQTAKTLLMNIGCCPRAYSGAINQSSSYKLLIGYSNDLIEYTPHAADTIRLPDGGSISASSVTYSSNGDIWAGTVNQGLIQLREGKVIQHLRMADGLPDNSISKIIEYADIIWAASYNGLTKIDTHTGKVLTIFNKYNGIPNTKISDMVIWNDRIYLACGDQLISISTKAEQPRSIAPLININYIWVNDSLMMNNSQSIILSYNQNFLKVQLEGSAYRSQGDFRYKYRITGLEDTWNLVNSNNNIIRYSSLPPGNYIFEAYCVNEQGIESLESVRFQFSIQFPYWQTWWFILLISGIGGGIIVGIFWFQVQRIQQRNQERLERSQLERDLRISQLTALKAQMNPHFIFNVLNSIQGLYALNDKITANQQLSKFAKLVRLTLDMSNEMHIPLSLEMELLELYLQIEQIRFMGELQFDFIPPKGLDLENIKIPSLLIQPYVENAVKHGLLHKNGDKKIQLSVCLRSEEQLLEIIIDDNGIGRSAAAKIKEKRESHKSFASSANATRLQLLNTDRQKNIQIGVRYIDKKDELGQPSGTTVIILIPINLKF